MKQVSPGRHLLQNWDAAFAALALCGMVLIPVIEAVSYTHLTLPTNREV